MTNADVGRRAPAIDLLLETIDRAYDHKSWHGVNLRGSIRRVTAKDAAWRPGRGRHNIWEIVVHAAYWKYAVWRRLTGAPRGAFALDGSNWFRRPETPGEAAWKADIALLDRTHKELRAAIASTSSASLRSRKPGLKTTSLDLIAGIAAHDLYHAGQIQLIKVLRKS